MNNEIATHEIVITTEKNRTRKKGRQVRHTIESFTKRLNSGSGIELTGAEYRELKAKATAAIDKGEPDDLLNKRLDNFKDSGWFQFGEKDPGKRWPKNRWGMTLDLDSASTETPAAVEKLLSKYTYWLHPSINHTDEAPRYRLIIPYAVPIDLDTNKALSTLVIHQLEKKWCDIKSSCTPAQLFYYPNKFSDSKDFGVIFNEGNVIFDPVPYLENMWEHKFGGSYQDINTWPQAQNKSIQRMLHRSEADSLQANPIDKVGRVGDFCRCYSIVQAIAKFLPEVWIEESEELGRYTYAHGTSRSGGVVYPYQRGDYGDCAFLHSFHATDPYTERHLNAFDMVRFHKFGELDEDKELKDDQRMPSYKAMVELCNNDEHLKEHVAKLANYQMLPDNVVPIDKAKSKEEPKPSRESNAPIDDSTVATARDLSEHTPESAVKYNLWYDERRKFIPKLDPQENNYWLKTFDNLCWVLGSVLSGRQIGYNKRLGIETIRAPLVIGGDVIIRGPRESEKWNGRPLTAGDIAALVGFVERSESWKGGLLSEREMKPALAATLERHLEFDPVVSYLENLAPWDKETDCGDVLHTNIKGVERTEYNMAATRHWMISAVARALDNGCRAQEVLVLHGQEGAGKSSTFEHLCPNKQAHRDAPVIHGGAKEFHESINGGWLVELAELDTLTRSAASKVKGWVSQSTEVFRAAYGRSAVAVERNWMAYGTCNDDDWLRSDMSTRRWLPVEVSTDKRFKGKKYRKKIKKMQASRDQYWAHALELWRSAGCAIPPLSPALRTAQDMAVKSVMTPTLQEEIQQTCESWLLEANPDYTTSWEVIISALNEDPRKVLRPQTMKGVNAALRKMGYRNKGNRINKSDPRAKMYFENELIRIDQQVKRELEPKAVQEKKSKKKNRF